MTETTEKYDAPNDRLSGLHWERRIFYLDY